MQDKIATQGLKAVIKNNHYIDEKFGKYGG